MKRLDLEQYKQSNLMIYIQEIGKLSYKSKNINKITLFYLDMYFLLL